MRLTVAASDSPCCRIAAAFCSASCTRRIAAESTFCVAAAFTAWETIRCPAAWLRRVAQRAHYRQAVSREIPVETAPDRPGPLSVTGAVEFRDEAREVLAALAELPARQRRLVSGPLMCLLWLE